MNIGEELTGKLLYGSTIPDIWTMMINQYGDDFTFGLAFNITIVSNKTIIPMNTSITNFHPRIAIYVENFFLHP